MFIVHLCEPERKSQGLRVVDTSRNKEQCVEEL